MAKAPEYIPGQVRPTGVPGVRFRAGARPSAFGGAEAEQIGRLGVALEQVAATASELDRASQNKKDKALARSIYNRANAEMNHWLTSDLYNREGEDAVDSYIIASTKFEEMRKSYVVRLKNESQRELFNASFDTLKVGHLNRVIGFQEQQRDKLEKVTIEAENLQSIETAVANRTDPNAILEAESTIVANTQFLSRAFPKVVRDIAVDDATNLLYTNVMEALTSDSPGAALAFFEANIDKFKEATKIGIRDNLSKLAEAEVVRDTAVAISDSGLSLENQLAEVDKIEDARIAKQVRRVVKERANERKVIANANAQKIVNDEWTAFSKNPRTYSIPNWLPVKEQDLMEKRKAVELQQWAYEQGAGPAPVTDWPNFNRLMSMTPDELNRVPMRDWGDLAPAEWNKVLAHLNKSRSGSGSSKGVASTRVRTPYQQFNATVAGMKYFTPKFFKGQWGKNVSREQIQQRKSWFFEQAAARLALIPEEEQTEERVGNMIREELMAPVRISRWGRDLYVKAFEVPYLGGVGFEEEEVTAALANRPKPLKDAPGSDKFSTLQYDPESNTYFLDVKGGAVRRLYDRVTGEYQGSLRIAEEAVPEETITVRVGGE